jgi:hypothetical protein
VLVRDDFPEFGTNLVTALSSLDVNDFSHVKVCVFFKIIIIYIKSLAYILFE